MTVTTMTEASALVELIRKRYPGWSSFQDKAFNKDEVEYKRRAATTAQSSLSQAAIEELIQKSQFDEILNRTKKVGQDTNLLFLGVPSSGDLNILYTDNLDKHSFATALLALFYGSDQTPKRLDDYLAYLASQKLPNKWTFPTYFLFLLHPETELFIKPTLTSRFLKLVGEAEAWSSTPSGAAYSRILEVANRTKEALSQYSPRDMIDIQSLIWVSATAEEESSSAVSAQKLQWFKKLYDEYLKDYPQTTEGKRHIALYDESRRAAADNFSRITAAADRGEDVTDAVLLGLLPHVDNPGTRQRGAWVHWAPSINGDIRSWFEGAGLTRPGQWPEVAKSILGLVTTSVQNPELLASACIEFVALPTSKGFQTGMMSPILNALRSDRFALINSKSRPVLNYLTEQSFPPELHEYPRSSAAFLKLAESLSDQLQLNGEPRVSPNDMLDMFCHWVVAIKKPDLGQVQYWKISPGEGARFWPEWRDSGYVAIGAGEFGDLTDVSKADFDKKRDELLPKHKDWTKAGIGQLWRFVRMTEGDRVVANRGREEVLGFGTVVGPYYYESGAEYPHRFPVQWDDLQPRAVSEGGWTKTLIELDSTKFNTLLKAPLKNGEHGPKPSDAVFPAECFEVLTELHRNPTSAFYASHKVQIQRLVEEPLEDLLRAVASHLPEPIAEVMETEKKILARILKNDYGKGGAWEYYWGAFYPKGGKRTEDAQLFLWINHECVRLGFYIGTYGSNQRARFLRNASRNYAVLVDKLRQSLSSDHYEFGAREWETDTARPTWEKWLKDAGESGIEVARTIPRDQAIRLTKADLQQLILDTYENLFPLVLLATSDNPMPELEKYFNGDEGTDLASAYSIQQLAADTSYDVETLQGWLRALERKGQAIIYGPPGTGKTYLAERLAKHLISESDGAVELVQFHPAYSYEDFIQGIRPQSDGDGQLEYPIVAGRFLEFCKVASARKGTCVLIIDEINRANLARVLGELMYLLEYRDKDVPLASGNRLRVPSNVRIIGTMNTADRSIALVDHALRRRFAFIPLVPNYETLRLYHEKTGANVEGLIGVLREVNKLIGDSHYEIGISFFLKQNLSTDLESIWRMEIEPYLEEFFFDRRQKLAELRWEAIQNRLLT
jgi:5-methylcytosine-specific restriction protein B